jgi:hypothetical protein
VAFLGDSFTLGIGVKDTNTIPANVERELQRNYSNIDVLSFGVSDTNTSYQITLLKEYVWEFKPDIVVVIFFLNDANRIGVVRFLSKPNVLSRIRKYSYFANALIGSFERPIFSKIMIRHYHAGFSETSQDYQLIKSALKEGRALSAKHQFDFIVAVYPVLFLLDERYPFRTIHQNIEHFCKIEDILFVDWFNTFFGKSDKEMWVHSTDQHANEVAQRLVAIELTNYLRDSGLIDKAFDHHRSAAASSQ